MDPYAPAAVPVSLHLLTPCRYSPLYPVTSAVASVSVGTTDDGTATVMFLDAVPIVVLPFFVVTVTVPVPLVAFGICDAQPMGTASVADVPTLLAVTVCPLNVNVTLCVKLDDTREIVTDKLLPMLTEGGIEKLDARGIVSSVIVP